ncbi:hypothetical protein O6H91_23G052600 [Diphasiastrum complanatum]|uniref:Uncharacterized protein n=1 Tax=Diphasiastrum complanatum TaxID=34168 RepID=A0ACC2AAU9_DIPCM|nr:hypothetical protein O6H91_23G052600 [Diphasiastrum complanatum]
MAENASALPSSNSKYERSKSFPLVLPSLRQLSRICSMDERRATNSNSQDQQLQLPDTVLQALARAERIRRCPYSAVEKRPDVPFVFQMPLHYPKYTKEEYETMPEWKLDMLFEEYGLPVTGSENDKRNYCIGAFVWRD